MYLNPDEYISIYRELNKLPCDYLPLPNELTHPETQDEIFQYWCDHRMVNSLWKFLKHNN
jgi:hypothetical protein